MVHVVHAHPMRSGHLVKSKRVETAVMFVQHTNQSSASRYPCRMTDDRDQVESNWRCGKCPPNTLWAESQASLHARPLSVWRFDSRWRLSQRMEELCSHARRWCAECGSQRTKARQSFGRRKPAKRLQRIAQPFILNASALNATPTSTRTVTRVHDGKIHLLSPNAACRGGFEVASAVSSVGGWGICAEM
jgi:hypothetical protein